jgi:hypothetical protein
MKATIALGSLAVLGMATSLQADRIVTLEEITLPEEYVFLSLSDASADGSVFIGTAPASLGRTMGYAYTNGQFSEFLGMDSAVAISADGTVIVGSIQHKDSGLHEAARWIDGELTLLGDGGFDKSWAYDVSGDGKVIVMGWIPANFVWEDGVLSPLSKSKKSLESAGGISFNGSVIVGQYRLTVSQLLQPVFWSNCDFTTLEILPGDIGGDALDVTDDGSLVVGVSVSNDLWKHTAVRWVDGSVVELQGLPGTEYYGSLQVSADGSLILGQTQDRVHFDMYPTGLVVWTRESGYSPLSLESFLDQLGFDTEVIQHPLVGLYGMVLSKDGNTILLSEEGETGLPELYRINLDAPAWAGFAISDDAMDVNTGDFMGWINVFHGDYIWSYAMDGWFYCPEANVHETGAWVYVPR